jgi:hypothetical protein
MLLLVLCVGAIVLEPRRTTGIVSRSPHSHCPPTRRGGGCQNDAPADLGGPRPRRRQVSRRSDSCRRLLRRFPSRALRTVHCAPDAAVSDAPLACGSFCGMRVGDLFVLEPFEVEVVPVVPPVSGLLMPVPPCPAVPPPPPPVPPPPAPPAPCANAAPANANRITEQTTAFLAAFSIASLIALTPGQH